MPSYFIWTIGCQMNKAESQRIVGYLNSVGHRAASLQEADLIVLNTCVVRQSAEDKVLGTLGLLSGLRKIRPNLSIILTGCFVDSNIDGLKRRFPQVDFFFRPGAFSDLIDWAKTRGITITEQRTGLSVPSSPRAFVPIIQGCDNFCSYCIVPYRRGREKSRSLGEITCEVEELVRRGVKEVILLGQNVDSYGHDLLEKPDLPDLLTELNGIDGLARIRFLTNHPKDVSLKLIKAVVSLDKVCEHLELPVQAGNDNILRAMRRGYTAEQYRGLVHAIRYNIPEISLSTDVVIGFPGETEEQFEDTFSLLEEMRFDVVHAAAYSPRPGTIAWRKYEDSVPPEVKKKRLNRIEELQAGIAGAINLQLQGKIVQVLVEGR
jgi:tRNA-2-methylthio-N6-dimethylallyladenosine synthase